MKISVIIPTLNEGNHIPRLLEHLCRWGDERMLEVIVSDGGSTDGTIELVEQAEVNLISSEKGRAVQMNTAAAQAKGEVLYFIHADTLPPPSFCDDIERSLHSESHIGSYRLGFDKTSLLLRINCFFTRFQALCFRGGDQTLFVKRSFFESLGGYNDQLKIMEEYDFIKRAKVETEFSIIPKSVKASSRKYENNNYFKVQLANMIVFNMFNFGFSQDRMYRTYEKLISR